MTQLPMSFTSADVISLGIRRYERGGFSFYKAGRSSLSTLSIQIGYTKQCSGCMLSPVVCNLVPQVYKRQQPALLNLCQIDLEPMS